MKSRLRNYCNLARCFTSSKLCCIKSKWKVKMPVALYGNPARFKRFRSSPLLPCFRFLKSNWDVQETFVRPLVFLVYYSPSFKILFRKLHHLLLSHCTIEACTRQPLRDPPLLMAVESSSVGSPGEEVFEIYQI